MRAVEESTRTFLLAAGVSEISGGLSYPGTSALGGAGAGDREPEWRLPNKREKKPEERLPPRPPNKVGGETA